MQIKIFKSNKSYTIEHDVNEFCKNSNYKIIKISDVRITQSEYGSIKYYIVQVTYTDQEKCK